MAVVRVTQNLHRHVPDSAADERVEGSTVGEVLDAYFALVPQLRGYVVDDTGAVRKHMTIFVDGAAISDRSGLSDPVPPGGEVFIMQALSGG